MFWLLIGLIIGNLCGVFATSLVFINHKTRDDFELEDEENDE